MRVIYSVGVDLFTLQVQKSSEIFVTMLFVTNLLKVNKVRPKQTETAICDSPRHFVTLSPLLTAVTNRIFFVIAFVTAFVTAFPSLFSIDFYFVTLFANILLQGNKDL